MKELILNDEKVIEYNERVIEKDIIAYIPQFKRDCLLTGEIPVYKYVKFLNTKYERYNGLDIYVFDPNRIGLMHKKNNTLLGTIEVKNILEANKNFPTVRDFFLDGAFKLFSYNKKENLNGIEDTIYSELEYVHPSLLNIFNSSIDKISSIFVNDRDLTVKFKNNEDLFYPISIQMLSGIIKNCYV